MYHGDGIDDVGVRDEADAEDISDVDDVGVDDA